MVPDWVVELAAIAAVLSLVSIQPVVYRFVVAWWWPFSVSFQVLYPVGLGNMAQVGLPTQVRVTARNRTPDSAFFQFSILWPPRPIGQPDPVVIQTYRDFPMTERFSGLWKLGPLERQVAVIALTPVYRGEFSFEVHAIEFYHPERYPNWLRIRRRILGPERATRRPRVYGRRVDLSVRSWAVSADNMAAYIGRDLTAEERVLDKTYGEQQARGGVGQ